MSLLVLWITGQRTRTVHHAVPLHIGLGHKIYSGAGGQLDFVRGAKLSKGGKSIIAMASRTSKGLPKIVPTLRTGAGVVTPRADVQWVVTEYGAVNLYGKSLQERSRLLISVAHPDDREALSRNSTLPRG